MPTMLQWIQDDVWSEDMVEEITISRVEGDESRREVGCQWKCPGEEEEQRKEVGCQSNTAERRDAAVQVNLLTQQLSGVAWRCVSVREDGPGGGTLLHHCCAHQAAAENTHPQQTAPLPSMPLCEPLPLPLADASAAPPPGLIAPLSPRLAEEDEEEDDEGPLKNKTSCANMKQTESSAEKKKVRRRRKILWVKQSKGGVKSWPGISTHIQRKTASNEERTQPDQSVKKSKVGVNKKQPEETSQKCSRTSIQKGRPETQTKDTQQQNEEGKEKRRNKEGAEGGVKSVRLRTKWVQRQRRSVGPPIRFLLEYEEKSHGLSTANYVKEVKGKVIEEVEQTERTESRLEEASMGVEKQPCQLPVSILQHRRKPRLLLHRYRYQRNKCFHGTRGAPASAQDGDGRPKEVVHAEVIEEKEKEKESLLPAPTEAPDGTTHKQSSPRRRRWQKNDDEPASKRRCKEEEEVKPVCVEKEVKEVLQRPRRTMVGPPIRYLLESELPHRLVTANLEREEKEGQEDMTDQDIALIPICRQGRPRECMTDMEAVGGALETAAAPRPVKRAMHWNKMKRHRRPNFVNKARRCSEKMEQQNQDRPEEAIRMQEERRRRERERNKEDQLERVITPPQRLRRTMVGPPIRYLLESELPHRLVTANLEREEEEGQKDMTDQDMELTPICRLVRPRECMTDMEAVGGASEKTEAPRPVKRAMHWNKMKRHRRPNFINKSRRCSEKMEVQNQDPPEEAIRMQQERRRQERERNKEGQSKKVIMAPQRLRRTMVGPPIRYLLESELPHRLVTANLEREEEEGQEDMTDQNMALIPICRQGRPRECMTDMEAVGGVLETAEAPRPVKRAMHWNKMKRHRRPNFVNKARRCSEKMEQQNQDRPEEAIRMQEERRRRERERNKEDQLERVITPPQRLRRTMVGPPIRYLLESELPHRLVTANLEREEEEGQKDMTDQDMELTPICRLVRPRECMTDMEAVGGASEKTEAPRPVKRAMHWNKMKRHRRPNFVIKEMRCSEKMEVQNQDQPEEAIRMKQERRWQETERKKEDQSKRVIMPRQRLRRTMVGPPIRYLLESEEPLHVPRTASNKKIESARRPLKITAEGGASGDKIDRPGDTPLMETPTGETGNERQTDMTNPDEPSRLKNREVGGGALVITDRSGAAETQTGVIAMEVVWQEGGQMEERWRREREEQTNEVTWVVRRQNNRERRRRLKMEDQLKKVITPPLQRPRRTMVSPPVRYLVESEENRPGRANQDRAERRRRRSETGGGAYGDTLVIGVAGDSQWQRCWNLESTLIYIDPDSREATVISPCCVSLQRLL